MLHLYWSSLPKKCKWWHWECWQHPVMPTPVPMAWHGRECHVASHFCHLGQRNAMLLLASSVPDGCTNGITRLKGHFAPPFHHLDIRNIMVPLTMPSAKCDTPFLSSWPKNIMVPFTMLLGSYYTNDIMWCQWQSVTTKKSCCYSFWYLDIRNVVVSL